MNVLVVTYGTRGDVQPFAALAHALNLAGHEATLVAPATFASLAEPYRLRFVPVDDGALSLLDEASTRMGIETGRPGVRDMRGALALAHRPIELLAPVMTELASSLPSDLDLVVHPPGIPAYLLADALEVPAVPACLQPGWVLQGHMAPGFRRILQWQLQLLLRLGDRWGRDLLKLPRRRGRSTSLRRADGSPATVLQAFSRHLLHPAAALPPWVQTTGFWFLPAAPDWAPSPGLAAFLAAGESPVYIGFGSMTGADPRRSGRIVLEAIQRARLRAVVATGRGGLALEEVPAEVFVLDQAPHDWLFPRMAAIVHHGGSGTTGAALASGRPQVVCPFAADQPFWAANMQAQGVAPAPQPQRKLTADGLAKAITQALSDQSMAMRAAELGKRSRAEDGVVAAVGVLEQVGTERQAS
jgi:sterol 3beta-glucosyltransferase